MNNPPQPAPRSVEELDQLIAAAGSSINNLCECWGFAWTNAKIALDEGRFKPLLEYRMSAEKWATTSAQWERILRALYWERRAALAEVELAKAKSDVEVAEEERDNEADRASEADENSRFWIECATAAINAVTPILHALDMEPEIAGLTWRDDDWGTEYEDAVDMMNRAVRKIEKLKAERDQP